jgi:hypothetical protein
MNIQESLAQREVSLLSKLREKQAGIDDRTGKGLATELVIEETLLRPFLPPNFDCAKGAVVCADRPTEQSPAIDRVVFDRSVTTPLVYDQAHSIFPIEVVAGVVEITMHLDSTKLKTDIERMIPIKAMTRRRYVVPKPGSRTRVLPCVKESLAPRSFVVGMPADSAWDPKSIAGALRTIQVAFGPPTHVHGLYVIGVGFFFTIPVENETETPYRIAGWTGPDRVFRFASAFRSAFDRWEPFPEGWSADLSGYVPGKPTILEE